MKNLARMLCLVSLLLTNSVYAVRVKSLYQAELPVISQSESDRSTAIKEGLKQVLIKLSGNPDIEKNRAIKTILKKAEYYVQEYGYLNEDPLDISQYNIRVRYNQSDITHFLKHVGIPFWGSSRPLILVWLGTKNEVGGLDVIGADSKNRLLDVLKDEGQKFGLPMIFPIMDMTDMNQISEANGIQFSLPTLVAAAKRYSPDVLFIGTVEEKNGNFVGHWELVSNQSSWQWDTTAPLSDDMIKKAVSQVTQKLAKQYALAN